MKNLPECPKCGYQAESWDDPLVTAYDGVGECPACGVLVAKYLKMNAESVENKKFEETSKKPKPVFKIIFFTIIILMMAYIYFPVLMDFINPPKNYSFGSEAESAGEAAARITAHARGKKVKVHSLALRRTWKFRADEPVCAVALSTKGEYLATASRPNGIFIWEKGLVGFKQLYEIESSINTVDAISFAYKGRRLVVIGDDDRKLEIFQFEQEKMIDSLTFSGDMFSSYRLRVSIDDSTGACSLNLSETKLQYVQLETIQGRGPSRLQDTVSGDYVKSYNDGWKASFEPAKSLSWSSTGRYSVCAERDCIVVWKLCSSRICNF